MDGEEVSGKVLRSHEWMPYFFRGRRDWLVFFAGLMLWIGIGIDSHAQIQYQSAPPEAYREVWAKGDTRRALAMINRLIEERPELERIRAFRYLLWLSDRAALQMQMGQVDQAIADLEAVTEMIPEPAFLLRLIEAYRYRGRKDEYQETLKRATDSTNRRWSIHTLEMNLLAMGRIAEWNGENPKMLLSSLYTSVMENRPEFAPGFVAAGDLSFRKGAYDLAETYYQQALNVDAVHEEALAGLAETYWKSGDPRLEEILKPLIEIHPHHPRAIAIQVEQHLDLGDAEKALELIEPILQTNPNELHFRSLQAAAYFLLDDLDALKTIQEQTLQFNPYCSEVYRIPGRVASRHYRFTEAAALQRWALEIDPDDYEARALYARDLLRLGEDEAGRKELEQAFAADPFDVQVFNMLNLLDALASFDVVKQYPFVLRLPKEETPVWADEALALLRRAYELYREKYKIELNAPIQVQIFDDHDDFMVRSVGLPGSIGFMGICFGQLITMDSPTARTKHSMNWRSVLWHEFVHVITLQKTKNRMPRWLSEGISVYEELEFSPACGQKMELQYKPLIAEEGLPGVAELERYFTQPASATHVMLGYFFSAEFIKYYVNEFGTDRLVNALERIGEGAKAVDSLAAACERTVEEIDKHFKQYLEERLVVYNHLPDIPRDKNALVKWWEKVTDEKPDMEPWLQKNSPFTDALRKGTQALKEEQWEEAETELKKAHELFPDYTADNAPLQQLCLLYEKWGKREKWKQALKQEIEWNATDFDACRKLVAVLREDEEWDAMVRAAEWGLGIDPFDVALRKAVYEGLVKKEEYARALDALRRVLALDSARRVDYQCESVGLLMKLQRWEQAKKETVALLEDMPHYWRAQELLLRIVEREKRDE